MASKRKYELVSLSLSIIEKTGCKPVTSAASSANSDIVISNEDFRDLNPSGIVARYWSSKAGG